MQPLRKMNIMKKKWMPILLGLIMMAGNGFTLAQENNPEPFLGMWALNLEYENNNAGWLKVTQQKGYLDSELLWRWGSVYQVDFTFVNGDQLFLVHGRDVVRKRDGEGNPVRTTHPVEYYEISVTGDLLEGWAHIPNSNGLGVESVHFTGKRIPPFDKTPDPEKIKFGEPVNLFNGKDLDDWELVDPNTASGWTVVDGILVNDPVQHEGEAHINYGNLKTMESFGDFNLKVEVNVPEGSNSGIYLRGNYEIQVMDSYGKDPDSHNMGALYSRITPLEAAEKPAGEWQQLDITLFQRHLTVILNGTTIIDNQPVKGITGGALTSDDFSPGPIYLQGDHGKVSYRNIMLTPVIE
jgi:hypothetical protein